jgi:dipeptidyl aminopeptidase/acylaminoacyl peptidase
VPLESDGAGLRAGKAEPFVRTPFDERHPSFSSDGRWLAYASDESGAFQVYVRSFPDKGGKWQVSNDGGLDPEWSPTGRELFFRTADNWIMVANYTVKGDSFAADKPQTWSDARRHSSARRSHGRYLCCSRSRANTTRRLPSGRAYSLRAEVVKASPGKPQKPMDKRY